MKCGRCNSDNENYCEPRLRSCSSVAMLINIAGKQQVDTYAREFAPTTTTNDKPSKPLDTMPSILTRVTSLMEATLPAYAAHQQFVFALPDEIEDKYLAPMLCGGLTTYSPLVRNGCGKSFQLAGTGNIA